MLQISFATDFEHAAERRQPERKRSRRVQRRPRLQVFWLSGGAVEGTVLDDGEGRTFVHEMR